MYLFFVVSYMTQDVTSRFCEILVVVNLRCATPTSFLVRIAARGSSPDFFSSFLNLFVSDFNCEVLFVRVKCLLFLLQFGIFD